MKCKCDETGMNVNISNIYDYKKRSFAIKNHISRNNFDIKKILSKKGIELKKCAFCDENNNNFYLLTEINNNIIVITGIEYIHRDQNRYYKIENYCWGKNKTCPGKKLNPNSKEFLSKVLNIDLKESIDIIHKRNKSPFYKINHNSENEYKKYQARSLEWFDKNNKNRKEWIDKANWSRSIGGYQEKYGDNGIDKWRQIQKSKAITLENLINRYGTDVGLIKWNKWKYLTNINYDTFIRKYGKKIGTLKFFEYICKKMNKETTIVDYESFLFFCYGLLQRNSFYKLKSFLIIEYLKKFSFFNIGLEFFEISDNEFEKNIKDKFYDINYFDITESGREKYGKIFFTNTGKLLRSINELEFYTEFIKLGYTDNDIEIDKCYPNSKLRYDFYIKPLGIYVEIAGMNDLDWYKEKMNLKKKEFNSIIIEPKEIKLFLDTIRMTNE